jgi:hypothetical protein
MLSSKSTFIRCSLAAVSAVFLVVASTGCGDEDEASVSENSAEASVDPAGDTSGETVSEGAVELDPDLDACSLLDVAQVQSLTGESVNFATQDLSDISTKQCFWGATVPGVGAYVEVTVLPQDTIPTGSASNCTEVSVDGDWEESAGSTCAGTQTKLSCRFLIKASWSESW